MRVLPSCFNYAPRHIYITPYGAPPGNKHHLYTSSRRWQSRITTQSVSGLNCPCAGEGWGMPLLSSRGPNYILSRVRLPRPQHTDSSKFYYSDVLSYGEQCGSDYTTCCSLPLFSKTFPTSLKTLCTNDNLQNENVAMESFILRKFINY